MRRTLLIALCALVLFPAFRMAKAETDYGAGGAILIEGGTGRVIIAQNADVKLPMASTTKVMTALIALEHTALDEMVKIPDAAVGVEGSSMYLARGETLSMRDLLYGLMLTSGNDAAVSIAIHIGGSVPGFAALMNERAKQLGCENSHFVTPNGLHDDDHYTTARDLATIAAEAMKNPDFREIVKTTYHVTTTGDRARTLKNKNKTLWQYDGGCGIKTGYTKKAGKCLVFAAERGDTLLIGVLLRAGDMWGSAFSMLDAGFARVKTERFLSAGQQVASIHVTDGTKNELALCVKDDILYPMKTDGSDTVALTVTAPEEIPAPVNQGDIVGSITLYVNGADEMTTALVAKESIEQESGLQHLIKKFLHLFGS